MTLAVSTVELTLRMLVSLALVSALLMLITRFARNRFRLGTGQATIDVHHRHQLTKSSAVAVVRAGRRHFLIGVNDHAITLLAEGDDLIQGQDPVTVDELPAGTEAATGTAATDDVVDVRGSGNRRSRSKTVKGGARKRRSGAGGPASSGMGVIEALREKSVRRS